MGIKRNLIICGIVVLLLTFWMPDILEAGRFGGTGRISRTTAMSSRRGFSGTTRQNFNQRFVQTTESDIGKPDRPQRISHTPKNYDYLQAQYRRIVEQRENALRARIKSADTRPSDDIARIGRSHSMTRQVDFRTKGDLRDSRRFMNRRSSGRGTLPEYHRRLGPPRLARYQWLFKRSAETTRPLFSRHRRFRHRHRAYWRSCFYYYSLPYFVCYYYVPPYYYTVPYGLYPDFEAYYTRPKTEVEVFEKEPVKVPEEAEADSKKLVEVSRYLTDIASAFVEGDFEKAAEKAGRAVEDFPDNPVLLFVYCQSLFANEEYLDAAEVLIQALEEVELETQGIFYALGFYPDEDVLTEQISQLNQALEDDPDNSSLQLLLAYQLMGIGDFQQARELLLAAQADEQIADAAEMLLEALKESEKIRNSQAEQQDQTVEPEDL